MNRENITKEQVIKMIDEYIAEPNSINSEWLEALLICRKCIKACIDMGENKSGNKAATKEV